MHTFEYTCMCTYMATQYNGTCVVSTANTAVCKCPANANVIMSTNTCGVKKTYK